MYNIPKGSPCKSPSRSTFLLAVATEGGGAVFVEGVGVVTRGWDPPLGRSGGGVAYKHAIH